MPAAIPLAKNIWRIPTAPMDLINSYLLRSDDGSLALVDTGVKGAHKRIAAAIREAGGGIDEVTTIVLTHAHPDHVGSAAKISAATGHGTTVHAEDADDVSNGTGSALDRSTKLGRLLKRNMGSDPAPVERTMTDGEILPLAGGLQVVHTPGHTPGHVSLLHPDSGVLITGDAMFNMWSRRTWPMLAFCTDIPLVEKSVHVLADLDYTTAAFTHGPPIEGTGREAVREFLRTPRRFPGLW